MASLAEIDKSKLIHRIIIDDKSNIEIIKFKKDNKDGYIIKDIANNNKGIVCDYYMYNTFMTNIRILKDITKDVIKIFNYDSSIN